MTKHNELNTTTLAPTTLAPWAAGGVWLRSLRDRSEITARELAEQVGAPSVVWLLEVEAGLRPVPSSMYQTYAKHVGVAVSDFAATCLRHYDRKAYDALFGAEERRLSVAA